MSTNDFFGEQELAKLKKIFGGLKHLRTPDDVARRRCSAEREIRDDDWYLTQTCPPFEVDFFHKLGPSKGLRRLADKTQVMTGRDNRHIRSRRSHTDEVVDTATIISRILGLNVSLTQAIALGHDIGHTPLGHVGEEFLSSVVGRPVRHEVLSVIVAQKIERNGKGLNLTHQVLQGMLQHSRGSGELTVRAEMSPEAAVVMLADKISYIWADFNDMFLRSRRVRLDDYPELKNLAEWFGERQRRRVRTCILSLCNESIEAGKICFKDYEAARLFDEVKKQMYKVYPLINVAAERGLVWLQRIYEYLKIVGQAEDVDPALLLALMCDHEVIKLSELDSLEDGCLRGLSITEIIPHLRGRKIDLTDPDMSW